MFLSGVTPCEAKWASSSSADFIVPSAAEVLRPRDAARPRDVALLVERGRPHVDHHHVGIVAALEQPVGVGGAALHQRRRELRRPHLDLLAAELAAVGGPLLDAAVEDAALRCPK